MSLFASSSSSVASASVPRRQLWSALTASSSRALSTTPSRQAKPRRNTGKNPFDLAPWEAFQHDDVPTLGHEVLNRGRELLRYARTVEHELPNLESEYGSKDGGGIIIPWTASDPLLSLLSSSQSFVSPTILLPPPASSPSARCTTKAPLTPPTASPS